MSPRAQESRSAAPVTAASESEIRWDEAATFVRRRLGYELTASTREHLDDLVQEALVRLLRAVRREPIENLEALMTEIARRTAIDCLRRRTRWRAVIESEIPEGLEIADPNARADRVGDPLERVHFIVLEFFASRESRCRELAMAFFAEQDWNVVAQARGRSHEAVRKQWSRCLETLRSATRYDPGLLEDWSRAE
jgi:RNA polymerase sigma factor (sigma-70 family)